MSSHMGVEPETRQINRFLVKRPTLAFKPSNYLPTVQVQQHVGLEQVLGAGHLALCHTRA